MAYLSPSAVLVTRRDSKSFSCSFSSINSASLSTPSAALRDTLWTLPSIAGDANLKMKDSSVPVRVDFSFFGESACEIESEGFNSTLNDCNSADVTSGTDPDIESECTESDSSSKEPQNLFQAGPSTFVSESVLWAVLLLSDSEIWLI